MNSFSERIEVGGRYLTFYFNKVNSVIGERFLITVTNNEKKTYSLKAELTADGYKIINGNTDEHWLDAIENKLIGIINKNSKE